METIIGLGSAGCNVARRFEKHAQYKVLKIGHEKTDEKRYLRLPIYENPEDYEQNPPKVGNLFRGISEEQVLFIVCGASALASSSLIILEQLAKRKCSINILYITPEIELLGGMKTKQERAVRNILQQYARSAVFEKMFLVSNLSMEELAENLTIMNYHDSINELLVSTINMINVFNNTQSVSDTFSNTMPSSRIATFGFVGFDSGEEKLFFPLDKPCEKKYYYAIPQKKLESELHLFRKIVNQAKSKLTENTGVSYGIYSTQYEHDYVYVTSHSSKIQEIEKKD